MLLTFFLLSLLVNVGLIYGILNLLKQNEAYEDSNLDYDQYFIKLQIKLKETLYTIRQIDLRGAFEADDEVGDVFRTMKEMIEMLDQFIETEEEHGTKEEI